MIWYFITAVLALLIIIIFVKNRKLHRDVDRLTHSVEEFISGGKSTEFSTRDNHFAALQNAVADLEEQYRLEQGNITKKSRENTEFISDVSHQLKTPLAGLKLYVEMEQEQNPGEHTEKELALIEKMEGLIYKVTVTK